MKKIGILTLPIKTNYGGILQVYALQTFLKRLGYDAWFIKRRWNCEKQTFIHKVLKVFYHKIVIRKFNAFINSYIQPQTEIIDTKNKGQSLINKGFDTFVVGSDQIWRMRYVYGADYNYFLDFTGDSNVKRVSYAASFGVDYWDDDTPELSVPKVKSLLERFDAISVRERSGVDICQNTFGLKAVQLIDPTLLLDKETYLHNLNLTIKQKKYVGVYLLDRTDEKIKMVMELANTLGFPVKYLNESTTSRFLPESLKEFGKPGVRTWLKGLAEAAFIITDSFHGTAFSLIFEKQFIVIGNEHRGMARFESILNLFGILDRLLLPNQEIPLHLLSNRIDYSQINLIKHIEQEKSLQFIKTNID